MKGPLPDPSNFGGKWRGPRREVSLAKGSREIGEEWIERSIRDKKTAAPSSMGSAEVMPEGAVQPE